MIYLVYEWGLLVVGLGRHAAAPLHLQLLNPFSDVRSSNLIVFAFIRSGQFFIISFLYGVSGKFFIIRFIRIRVQSNSSLIRTSACLE